MSEALEDIRQVCDEIIKRVDRRHVADAGRANVVPQKLWDAWAETGLLGIGLPEAYGGIGGDLSDLVHAIDWQASAGLNLQSAIPNFMSRIPVVKYGTDEQRNSILPATATGESRFSFAITEADAGSNTFKIRTTAIKQEDGSYKLSGSKVFITGFLESAWCLVVARTTPYDPENRTKGISVFLVRPDAQGVSASPMDIGIHKAEKQYAIQFENVILPPESLLGPDGEGLKVLFDCLNPERLIVAAINIGSADYVLKKAAEYAANRAPFDVPIGSYQAVQHPLAAAKANTEAARCYLYQTAEAFDRGETVGIQSSTTKYLASMAVSQATNASANVYGGSFADMETDIIGFFLQAKLSELGPVNNSIVLSQIAQKLLGLPKGY
ncbi:acyl-CoA dehydrogenase family protein [Nocardia abscessus]|uniref:acyl-CoA dehydrogenase family protein n=1 Tax=Nocardia abscessus TaxID=120957 RepID=UPI002454FDA9|nr:acyl-CoA dehydrogenase family protein [Nocardia abscessus]